MATTSLGRLTLDLVVQTASFSEPLSRAERQARTSSQGIANSLNIAAIAVSALSGAIAGLSVAQLVTFSDQVIQTGNDIQKFSKLANASVREFQYYAKGAETAGISLESFADKMKDMQDRIGDFQQTGGGPLADFFTNIAPKVGVTIQQFQKLSGPEALQLFYNSLEKAGASTNDMKFYMEAIISDSSLLIPLLENGGEGFKKWGDAAEKAGAIMSDDLVKSLAQARENLQLMDLQWQGVEARLVNNVVPAIETVIENWDDIKAVTIAVSAGIATRFVPALVVATYQLGQTAIFAVRAGVGLASFARSAGATAGVMALLGGPAGLAMLATQIAVAGGAYLLMTKHTEDATSAFEEQGLAISELREKYKSFTAAQLAIKGIEASEEVEKQTKELKSLLTALEQFENDLKVQGDIKQFTAIQAYLASLKQGGDEAKNAFAQLQKQGLVSESTLKFVAELDTKINAANNSIDRQKEIQKLVKDATNDATKAQQDQAKAVKDSAKAWQSLTQKQREYITQAKQDVLREGYIKTLVREGVSVDKANVYADAQVATNGENAFIAPLSKDVLLAARENFNLKNYTFGKPELEAIARAQGIAKANNFAQIESLYGLPAGTLAALILQESGANAGARSHTGAIGLFQTTSVFRKQYGLNAKSSTEEIATAAAKDLSKHLAEFGAMDKALMAYNAGAGGLRTYLKGGLSDSKRKEVAGYAPGFQKWFAGVNGKSSVDNSILMPTQADQLELINKAAESQQAIDDAKKEVDARYYTEAQRLAREHQDNIDKITLAYAGTPQLKEKLAQEDALYAAQIAKLESDKKEEYNQYFAFETDRIKQIEQNFDRQKELIDSNAEYEYGKSKKALEIKAALERQKQVEIAAVKREEDAQIQSAFEGYLNQTEIVVKRYQREREEILQTYSLSKRVREEMAKSKDYAIFETLNQASDSVFQVGQNSAQSLFNRLNPEEFSKFNLQNQYSSDYGMLKTSYNDEVAGIRAISDENLRNSMLLDAHEQYLQSKAALDADYAQKERDLDQQNFETKMQVYSQIAGMTGQVFSDMTALLEQSVGKSNALYKTMFFASKAASIAQAIVNTEEGATKALAQGGAYGSVLAGVVRATGYASVGIMAAQTIQGMAHNGIDNIPREGTWLLDGGERVLNPQQNKDLTNYLNNRQNGPAEGNVQISQQITFADGSASVNTQGQKQIAESVNNAMDAWARRESRQGGVLFNLVRR
ncbi:putative soluble lytic transglycosylase fused to an ABC-type amino acid-binding protein [Acinetobacter baumannii]|uniref:transglycosylase SLT domain-containing protein n=2 Tax=Acinetobacter baumannii TaxID=470 RepID=UPI000DE79CEC|nr:transglycosylase SLT domain-containing protein [Acinetobacter baumannii]MCJ9135531.1 transglycosylase SLT domain-containing protein [Acinetobacter baumannii]MCJ9278414.1 transglycosylase SLT domain-containing protein [Acinetobacter baumannii]MCJ9450076.1 transglycosylase SLT domain-containing protein [Acinetobacter baumannii]MCJ9482895.1 transglycosylase SLT domain-containing protein [Acinetobacter baumannii]MCJ9553261.1 transglycosylase SLT domain-containing protein [Acinetobacter baumanni